VYDSQRAHLKSEGKLIQNDLGEHWAQNAHPSHSGDNDSEDEDEDDGYYRDEPHPMSQAKEQILKDMEPFIKIVLDSSKHKKASKKLEELNQKMRTLNVEENEDRKTQGLPCLPPGDRTLAMPTIINAGKNRRTQLAIVNDANKETGAKAGALQVLNHLQKEFREHLQEMHLPPEWVYSVPNMTAPSPASQGSSAGNRQTSNPPTAADSPTDQSSSDAMDTTPIWTAGQARTGEKILAYRPTTSTGISTSTGEPDQVYSNIKFVVETEGNDNPIKIVDQAYVGFEPMMEYLKLPEDQKCKVAGVEGKYTRLDGFKFGKIKGVAHDSGATANRNLPWTVVLINYDWNPVVVNRTALRKAKGERAADALIDEFLISVGEKPDGPKELRRLEQANNGLLLGQYGSDGRLGNMDTRFSTRHPRMLHAEEDLYHDLDPSSFPRAGTARMRAATEHVTSRSSRRDQLSDRNRNMTFNTPRESHRPTSARLQGPTPVRADPPVQPAPRTSTAGTRPDMIHDEQRRRDAAAGEQPAILEKMTQMMDMMQQLVVAMATNQQTQQSVAAT
jgi:hypothetical protein